MRFSPKPGLRRSSIGVALAALLFALLAARYPELRRWEPLLFPDVAETGPADTASPLAVKRVVDGDTIVLENGETVRYIGIDAPESVKPNAPMDCYGREAATRNRELVEGKLVRVERDVSERDRYGRKLYYVFLEDGTFVNATLVREGYAFARSYPPDVARQDELRVAEREAREAKRGLWAEATCRGEKRPLE